MTISALYQLYQQYPTVVTDTRHIQADSIFFALKGEQFNGNAYAAQALEQGAKYAVIDEVQYAGQRGYILVDDVLSTLQALARHHRQQLQIPIIGITGTNGKTTTKELLYAVLSQQFNTFATAGNLNNHIGVPLSLLAIHPAVEVAVIEMGANHLEEIAFLCDIAQPTLGLITNVGRAHLEGFGSFEGVIKTKGELYDYLNEHHGQLFLQADNPYLLEMAHARGIHNAVVYGLDASSRPDQAQDAIVGALVSADPYLTLSWRKGRQGSARTVKTLLTGSYNVENILAAIAVGDFLGMDAASIDQGISAYTPKNNRSQITTTAHNMVIADFYNANASSMAAALANIDVVRADRKAVILGDMFEMGEESSAEHQRVIALAQKLPLDSLIFVGEAFYAHRHPDAQFFQTTAQAIDHLNTNPLKGFMILLKASRGMAFEKIMQVL